MTAAGIASERHPGPVVDGRAGTAERIEVAGVVQGVGFRPFVHRTATSLGLAGIVGNDGHGVFIEVVGSADRRDRLVEMIETNPPPLARVDGIARTVLAAGEAPETAGFCIVDSRAGRGSTTLVPPDTAVCAACVHELFDRTNRRHDHPFITCTDCGPRYTIIEGLPYDRPRTTMAGFELCESCSAEYRDPTDRRYHAQPIGCHRCGPSLAFDGGGRAPSITGPGAVAAAAAAIAAGSIVAIKGLGGFHLACSATDEAAVARLRSAKRRPDKPFAVMAPDLDWARRLATVNEPEATLLTSVQAPIVLLRAVSPSPIAPSVAPGNPLLGVLLPYTAVHHLLLAALDGPVVLTSANRGGQPIVTDRAALDDIAGSWDAVLDNDRPIATACDDSVVRAVAGRLLPVRRARGYAPMPVPVPAGPTVLAVGGELKNTFCLAGDGQGWLSQHIGDMENLETLAAFELTVDRLRTLYGLDPEVVAVDAHPGYLTSGWARRQALPVVEVQHHHAHVAAVAAEHGVETDRSIIGFAFDGTGYGTDGTIWGGELLIADGTGFDRVAHLQPVPLPGGDAAVRNPNRVALAQLGAAGIAWDRAPACLAPLTAAEQGLLARQLDRGVACVPTTSIGRLFDAVASILDLRHVITYEAQAAIELEIAAATAADDGADPYRFATGDGPVADQGPVLQAIVDDLAAGVDVGLVALRFHRAVAALVATLADRERRRTGIDLVALTGGVFQNALLTELCLDALADQPVRVLTHSLVPPNDGGLALGQAYIAVASRITRNQED